MLAAVISSNWSLIVFIFLKSSATPFVWAQRKDRLFISVNLRDISGEKFELLPNSLTFSANSDGKSYSGAVNFFDEIDVEVKSERSKKIIRRKNEICL